MLFQPTPSNLRLTTSSHPPAVPRISKKGQLENEIASTMESMTLSMLIESGSESEEVEEDYDDLLSMLVLACHTVSNS